MGGGLLMIDFFGDRQQISGPLGVANNPNYSSAAKHASLQKVIAPASSSGERSAQSMLKVLLGSSRSHNKPSVVRFCVS